MIIDNWTVEHLKRGQAFAGKARPLSPPGLLWLPGAPAAGQPHRLLAEQAEHPLLGEDVLGNKVPDGRLA